MRLFLIFGILLQFSLPALASGTTLADGQAAYASGDYYRARQIFKSLEGVDAHMGACQAGLVIGSFLDKGEDAVRSLHTALDNCKAAMEINPHHIDARISFAIALGVEGKRLRKPAYAKASRLLLEDLLVVSNNYHILHGAIGGWHSEVYEAGLLARLFLGARRKTAIKHLDRATELAPKDVGIRFERVKYFARGNKAAREIAIIESEMALGLKADNAFETLLLAHLKAINTALKTGRKSSIKSALRAATAFDGIEKWRDIPAYPLALKPQANH